MPLRALRGLPVLVLVHASCLQAAAGLQRSQEPEPSEPTPETAITAHEDLDPGLEPPAEPSAEPSTGAVQLQETEVRPRREKPIGAGQEQGDPDGVPGERGRRHAKALSKGVDGINAAYAVLETLREVGDKPFPDEPGPDAWKLFAAHLLKETRRYKMEILKRDAEIESLRAGNKATGTAVAACNQSIARLFDEEVDLRQTIEKYPRPVPRRGVRLAHPAPVTAPRGEPAPVEGSPPRSGGPTRGRGGSRRARGGQAVDASPYWDQVDAQPAPVQGRHPGFSWYDE